MYTYTRRKLLQGTTSKCQSGFIWAMGLQIVYIFFFVDFYEKLL